MLVLLGLIKDKDTLKGYVFYNLQENAVQKLYSVDVNSLKTYYNGSTMVGVKLNRDGLLESTECSLSRFATFDVNLKSKDLKNKVYILQTITKDSDKLYKVIINLEVRTLALKQLLKYVEKGYTLINGKVVTKGESTYISAIKGSFAYMDLTETTTTITKEVSKEAIKEVVTTKVQGKEEIKEVKTTKEPKFKEIVKENVKESVDSLAYSIMIANRWLQKLASFEDLGRMFINYDMFLEYTKDVRVVEVFNTRNVDMELLNDKSLKECKDRITLITFLAVYRDALIDILKVIDIQKLHSSTYREIDNILSVNKRAKNFIINTLGEGCKGNLDTNTLISKVLKHVDLKNNAYLYYLTVLGSIYRGTSDYEAFLRMYSFGQSLNEQHDPVCYTNVYDIGYVLSQAIVVGYGNNLGLTNSGNGGI